MVEMVRGTDLPETLRREALRSYLNRYTKTHVPAWARNTHYRPQFADDQDWLANTLFPVIVRRSRMIRLARRPSDCESSPTWPDGEGLKGGAEV